MFEGALFTRLVARHPLPEPARSQPTEGLEEAAKAYAKHATQNGKRGPWWRVWRAIEEART